MASEDSPITVEDSNSINDFIQKSFDAIKNGIKASNSLPNAENFNFYSCFPTFNEIRNEQIKKIVDTMQSIVQTAGVAGDIKQVDVEEKFEMIVESNDIFLDRAGTCMDIQTGKNKNPSVELIVTQTRVANKFNGSWNSSYINKQASSPSSSQAIRLLAGKNIQRPQATFKDKIDNSQKPWQPKIKDKPNSLKPLAVYMEVGDEGEEVFCHPYEVELDKFEPPECQLIKKSVVKYKPLNETPLLVIEKVQDLEIMLNDLKNYKEIAVDLEHHSYRSFQGITCLMQISTRDTDYLVDTLCLRSELHVLNEIFTKPSILKVFHGADSDILWLQRDLSLYIVNMFDTHQAAKQLELPFLSLSYLLKIHCQIDPNKHFQLADWRIRPLPEELMKYAREDTHYLLYIKDILSNALIDSANGKNNILKAVYTQSTLICKKVYTKPIWTEESYMNMYRKSQKMFNNRQLYALKELHKWRDETARIEDDSTNYVLPNHMLLNIAETLPREMQGVLACCNPIPPLVRQNLLKIHKMILKAREQPLIAPVLEDDMKQRLSQRNQAVNSKSWMFNPHDLPNGTEARANLPCILNSSNKEVLTTEKTKLKPTVTIFNSSSEDENMESKIEITRKKKKLVFISPFERYKRVLPMVAEEQKKEIEKQQKEEAERIQALQKNQQETTESIKRVHEHFMKIAEQASSKVKTSKNLDSNLETNQQNHLNEHEESQFNSSPVSKSIDKIRLPKIQTLGQMHGKKRKRQLSPDIVRPFNNKTARQKKFNENKKKRRSN